MINDNGALPQSCPTVHNVTMPCLVPEGGKLRIDLRGELAGILSLCQESKKPSHDGQVHAEQIKMVAGARYQRCLHLDYATL